MTRLSLVLALSIFALPAMVVDSSAQSALQNKESFCDRNPTHPSCSVIMDQICAQTPSDPACMSDDDDDDSAS